MLATRAVRVFIFLFAILAVAFAAPKPSATTSAPAGPTEPASQCNTGPIQCCQSVEPATSSSAGLLLGLLGIVLKDLNVLVGITCTPVSVIGLGGNSCSADPVCCENNTFNGLIAIGCVPVNINL